MCNRKKEEVLLSEKEQLEYLNIIRSSILDMENFTDKLKTEEVQHRMNSYMFILSCLKEITPFLDSMEKGRKCEGGVKDALDEVFSAVKENNRSKYDSAILKLKEYFKE